MAHNIHFIIVDAESHEEAEERVMYAIEDWGDENNWMSCTGSVDQDNSIHAASSSSRFEVKSIEQIRQILDNVINTEPYTITYDMNHRTRLYAAYKNAEWRYKTYLDHEFNIWDDEIYSWDLNEVGITNIISDKDKKLYIVQIDMHS